MCLATQNLVHNKLKRGIKPDKVKKGKKIHISSHDLSRCKFFSHSSYLSLAKDKLFNSTSYFYGCQHPSFFLSAQLFEVLIWVPGLLANEAEALK